MSEPRTGGRILADALLSNGVERAFCVPGESYLALLDALYDSPIAVTVCRHEGAAALAAEAWGKLTGRPGIVMATRGPGGANASAGLHVGRQDSTPMILLLGQVGRTMRGREAFQEIDAKAFFGEVAKSVEEIDRADRIPEVVSRAFHVATAGRPGPVVLSLPEDMLRATAAVADRGALGPGRDLSRSDPDGAAPEDAVVGATPVRHPRRLALERSRGGERPALCRAVRPAGRDCSFRRQMLFDHEHPNYAGDVGIGINPDLAAPHQGCRRAPARRRPAERDAVLRLYADRHSRAAPGAGPCPSRRRGARPALPADARRQCQPDRLCRGARGAAAAAGDPVVGGHPRRQPILSRLVDADGQSRRGAARRSRRLAPPAAPRRRHHHQRRRQLFRLGASLLPLPPLRHAAFADLRDHGLRPAGGDRGETQLSGADRRLLSPATATSR